MRNQLAFYGSPGSISSSKHFRYLHRAGNTLAGSMQNFSTADPDIVSNCRVLRVSGVYTKKFFSQIPLFLFSGVFLKLFLYRPLPRTKKQVTLDFRYPVTYFFRMGPFFSSKSLKFQRNGQFPQKNLLLHRQVLSI